MSKVEATEAIEERKSTCSECGCVGVHVDTTSGEIVKHGDVVAVVHNHSFLMVDAEGVGELFCNEHLPNG